MEMIGRAPIPRLRTYHRRKTGACFVLRGNDHLNPEKV